MPYETPVAFAHIKGGMDYPQIWGTVYFYPAAYGVRVCAYIHQLPPYSPASDGKQPVGPFGFHIHSKGCCEGDFKCADGHYNPDNQPHGNHAGDFPVLFSNNGRSEMCFFTNRLNIHDIIGRSVIIHENPDDYRTQPSGNSGKMIACGVIMPYVRGMY